ncbi:MAG: serine hydrolase domain-containing protein [Betaproteobacteria bacterium]
MRQRLLEPFVLALAALVTAAAPAAAATDDAPLEAFVDGVVAAWQRGANPTAGAVVTVVLDGRVALLKGYGQADAAAGRPVDPRQTMFRIGSISKTFTYIATLQLIEQGKLGLDDPVNDRLPPALRIPDDGFAEPIRVRHLLTHSAGFEDLILGRLFRDLGERVETLHDSLIANRPARVRPPGERAVYSNYGLALLGAVVAQTSGLPFEDLAEQGIFTPLGMARTSFREPLPAGDARRLDAALHPLLASGHARKNGAFVTRPFTFVAHYAPAGSASATAADMARYMQALLSGGALDGARILSAAAVEGLSAPLLRNAPGVWPIGFGFMVEQYGRHPAFGHGGALLDAHANMQLMPSLRLGVFAACNSEGCEPLVGQLPAQIVAHLDPATVPPPAPTASTLPLAAYAGTYLTQRRPYGTAEKLFVAAFGLASVAANDDALLIAGRSGIRRMVPVGGHAFAAAEGDGRAAFLTDAAGRVTAFAPGNGVVVYDRLSAWQTLTALAVGLIAAGVVALGSLWLAWRRRRRGEEPRPGLRAVKATAVLNGLAWLTFLVLLGAAGGQMLAAGTQAVFTYPTLLLTAALATATFAAATTAVAAVGLLPVWLGRWRLGAKLAYSGGVVVLAGTLWVMHFWNLLGGRA